MGIVVRMADYQLKDNHGRTWVRCSNDNPDGTWWNMGDGARKKYRLKYRNEWNTVTLSGQQE